MTPPGFALQTHEGSGGCVVVLTGELDQMGAPRLRQELAHLLAAGTDRIILDLRQLSFLDSVGLGLFIGAFKRLRSFGGELVLRDPQPFAVRLLRTTMLANLLSIDVVVQAPSESNDLCDQPVAPIETPPARSMELSSVNLPCDPSSAAAARHWLASRLEGWSSDALSIATLLVSELVANAVIHARSDLTLVLQTVNGHARVAVIDSSPLEPVVRNYSPEATNGRGMQLVVHLAEHWGVTRHGDQKAVWIELVDTLRADDAWQGWPPESWPEIASNSAPADEPADPAIELVRVQALRLPIVVYRESQEHNDELLRELAFLEASNEELRTPPRLIELGRELQLRFVPASARLRAQATAAEQRGESVVDISMDIPRQSSDALTLLTRLLDEADGFCEQGLLITLPSSDSVVRFRHWYTDQVLRQVAGEAPQPWPFD